MSFWLLDIGKMAWGYVMVKNKRLLIISNEPLSNRTANGRTIKNLLSKISPCDIAQFYIHGEPDRGCGSAFFSVSDRDALNAFLFKKASSSSKNQDDSNHRKEKRIVKNCRNMVIRDIVWKSMRWWKKDFTDFVESFAPDAILFQAGDSPFMYVIAVKVSKKYKLPIIMYNSEEYPLKDKIYENAVKYSPFHLSLRSRLRRAYKKIMKQSIYCIYGNKYLEERYREDYPGEYKSQVFYTASNMKIIPDNSEESEFSLLYCGNLGVGRDIALCEVAKCLNKINTDAKLYVYGRMPSDDVKMRLLSNTNLVYGGEVAYEDLPALMSKASMLLHCENNRRLCDLKAAFSTKISDCLSSGRPFIVYASREFPFVKYLEEHDCAHIANDVNELEYILNMAIYDVGFRNGKVFSAVKTAEKNHNYDINGLRFEKILSSICYGDIDEKRI